MLQGVVPPNLCRVGGRHKIDLVVSRLSFVDYLESAPSQEKIFMGLPYGSGNMPQYMNYALCTSKCRAQVAENARYSSVQFCKWDLGLK